MTVNKNKIFSFSGTNHRVIGRAQILLSAVGFGAISPIAKFAYVSGIDAPLLLALRFLVASMALWAYFLIFKRDMVRIGRRELATCAALGLAGYGIFSSLNFKALETIPASIAGLLFFSYPAFVIAMDWLVTKQRPGAKILTGAVLTLGGIVIGVFGSLAGGLNIGVLFALGGAAWYAAYVITTRRLLDNIKPQTVALYVTSFAAAGFWFMGGPVTPHLSAVTGVAWVAVLALALISTVVALLSFFSGLEKLGSSEASQIGTFELIIILGLASLALGEHISMPVMMGAGLVVAGIVMGQIKSATQSTTQSTTRRSRFLRSDDVACES